MTTTPTEFFMSAQSSRPQTIDKAINTTSTMNMYYPPKPIDTSLDSIITNNYIYNTLLEDEKKLSDEEYNKFIEEEKSINKIMVMTKEEINKKWDRIIEDAKIEEQKINKMCKDELNKRLDEEEMDENYLH